jgi:cation:H+ antiporter
VPEFQTLPLIVNAALMLVSAAVVWIAGTRLSYFADAIAVRLGMGRALAGFLVLGGVTSLPELATTATASFGGNAPLALNNILGSIATNVLLLAIADAVLGRDALTSVVAHPATLLQGTLGIILLGVLAAGIAAGDVGLFGLGVWSAALVPLFALAVWLSSRHENRPTWIAFDHIDVFLASRQGAAIALPAEPVVDLPTRQLFGRAGIVAITILVAGYTLAEAGDAIAAETGIGASLVGFLLVGLATSLPEISSMVGAIKLRRYELAIGDIFGTNLFDLLLIPVADLCFRGGPILREAGRFEILAALLGILLTAIYVVGLLDRRNRTFLRMGYDSLAAIVTYGVGIVVLGMVWATS